MAFTMEGLKLQRDFILASIDTVNITSSIGDIIKSYNIKELDVTHNDNSITIKISMSGDIIGVGNEVGRVQLISKGVIIYDYINNPPLICTTIEDTFNINCVISN